MAEKHLIPPERLEQVEAWYLGGVLDRAIAARGAKAWQVTRRTVRNYLLRVRRKLAAQLATVTPEESARLAEEIRARVHGTLLRAIELAEREGDAKGMATAAVRLAELHRVMGPKQVEITGKDGGPIRTEARVVVLPALEDDDRGGVAAQPGPSDPVPGEPRG